jgi:hypothetical protein
VVVVVVLTRVVVVVVVVFSKAGILELLLCEKETLFLEE